MNWTYFEHILHLNLELSVYIFDNAGFCFQTGGSKPFETKNVLQCCLTKLFLHLSSWNETRSLSKNAWCCRMLGMLGYAKQIKPASCHRIHHPAWGKRPPKLFQSCSQFFQIAAAVCHSTPRKPLCYLSVVEEVLSLITDQCSLLQGLFSWSCHVSESI